MKKIISLFTTLSIVFSMLGTFTVFAEETAEQHISAYVAEERTRGNWETAPKKLFSRAELDTYLTVVYGEGKPAFKQYDDAFFADKYLCLSYLDGSVPMEINIVSIAEGTHKIVIEAALENKTNTEEYREYFAVIEADKTLANRPIETSLMDWTAYHLAYYQDSIKTNYNYIKNEPYVKAITSADELKQYCIEDSELYQAYQNFNFDEKCLLFIISKEMQGLEAWRVTDMVLDYGHSIMLTKRPYAQGEVLAQKSHTAVIEADPWYKYGDYTVTVADIYSTNDYLYEIHNCLKDITRKGRTSHTNGIVGVIMKVNGSYSWFKKSGTNCHGTSIVSYEMNKIFDIISKNHFNSNPKQWHCSQCETYDSLDGSYITFVDEDTFLADPHTYINNAYKKSENDANGYTLKKQK